MSFRGIQNKATAASLTADLSAASKKFKLYQVDNGAFPTINDCAAGPVVGSICLNSNNGTSYSAFQTSNSATPQTFCVTASRGGLTYRITEDSSSAVGDCANLYATGGTITDLGGYRIHTFTGSGDFTVAAGINSVDVLVVAGGGGAGRDVGGAGGGGGLIYRSAFGVSSGVLAVTVGAGGLADGLNGGNSVFSSLVAVGGGGGGTYSVTAGKPGGSGGGGGGGGGNPGGSGTAGQGFAGGTGSGSAYAAGSGGGAGGPGNSANLANGLDGGIGLAYSISGTSTYYSAGGGGGGSTSFGQGGLGGGGRGEGRTSSNGQNGTANTGGGAGGMASPNTGGATGGSGIVIVRYLIP